MKLILLPQLMDTSAIVINVIIKMNDLVDSKEMISNSKLIQKLPIGQEWSVLLIAVMIINNL